MDHLKKSPLPLPILEFFDFFVTGKFPITKNQKEKKFFKRYLFLDKFFKNFFIKIKVKNSIL